MEKSFTKHVFRRTAMLLLVTLLTTVTAWADNVKYIDASGTEQTVNATAVTDETTTMGTDDQTTWYYVSGNVENSYRIEVSGTVNLILADYCSFIAYGGLHLLTGNTLNIYVQSGGSGSLRADSNYHDAAIGGDGGVGADEFGGAGEDAGNVNIYGGYVETYGNIGGGNGGDSYGYQEDPSDPESLWMEGSGGEGGNGGTIGIYGGRVYVYNGVMGGGHGGHGSPEGSDGSATISLSWRNASDVVYANSYNGTVTLQKAFTDADGNNYAAGEVNENVDINGMSLQSTDVVISYEQTDATCTERGFARDCWYKPAIQQYYADEACTQEIAENAVVIPALGHHIIHHAAQGATFTTAGNFEYWHCDRCNKYFGDENGENDLELDDASSLTYAVEGNATDGYSIRIPKTGTYTLTLDNSVTSFKIYDDGGEGGSTTENDQPGNYSNDCDGKLVLIAPKDYAIQLTGNVMTESGNYDYLTVYRGTTADDNNILLNQKFSPNNGDAASIGSLSATSMLLHFYSDNGVNCAGLDLTATLVDAAPHSITISSATGGELTGPSTAIYGEKVTLTVTPAANYVLSGITVTDDATHENVEVAGVEWYNNQATFYMPGANVTVTPTFTTETANLSINIPKEGAVTATIPSAVTSFKIYDDGGEGGSTTDYDQPGNYSDNCDGKLVLVAPDGKQVILTGTILSEGRCDYLTVYHGTTADDSNKLLNEKSNDESGVAASIGSLSATSMLLHFYSDGSNNYAGLDLTARLLSDEYVNPVFYVDANGEEQIANNVPTITDETTTMGTAGQTKWYSVNGNVTIESRIELAGTVNLILTDGCHLYANKGMHLLAGDTLNVFTQSMGSGQFDAWGEDYNAAIGGDGGDEDSDGENGGVINIYGGKFMCNGTLGGGQGKANGTASINLSWTNAEDVIYAAPYNGTVTLLKAFMDENGNSYTAGEVDDESVPNYVELLSVNATVFHAQAEATCTEGGYTQDCWFKYATQKYYTDKACTEEIDEDDVVISALGHNMTHNAGTAATFTTSGTVDYWYCDRCKDYFCDEEGDLLIRDFDSSDVAFSVEGNATDGYYVRMPKFGTGTLNIDNSVASFKIYDDGGEGGSTTDSDQPGNYSDNCDGKLVLVAPDGKQVKLTGSILSESGCDHLSVYNGTTTNGSMLLEKKSGEWEGDDTYSAASIGTIASSSMLLYFRSDGSVNRAGLDLTATIENAAGVPLLIADNGDKTAVLDGSQDGELNIQSEVLVEEVVVDREFTDALPSTLMLPFAIDVDNANGSEFYTFSGVAFDALQNKWTTTMTQVEPGNSIAANTPCVVVPNGDRLNLSGSQTLKPTAGTHQTTQGNWAFKGTYAEKTWTAGDCGNDYGFAATSGKATDGVTDVEAGDFVKIAPGASISPMRSYLTYTGGGNPWAAARRHAAANLPQRISVVLKKADGSTTEIGTIENGELKIDNWYTLGGRKLDKQPAKKGLYVNKGKKVVVRK